MRVGLVGAGRIGTAHAAVIRDHRLVEQLVIADADPLQRSEPRSRSGSTRSTPSRAVFTSVDAVVVTAATAAHPELIVAGIGAGLPLFCEKPVAPDLEGSAAVLAEVSAAAPRCRSASSAASTRGTAPRARPCAPERSAGCTGACRDRRPGTTPRGVHSDLGRDVPGLPCPRLRHAALGHRPRGRRGVRDRGQPRSRLLRRIRRCRTRPPRSSRSMTARWSRSRVALQRRRSRHPDGAGGHREHAGRRSQRPDADAVGGGGRDLPRRGALAELLAPLPACLRRGDRGVRRVRRRSA